MANKSNNRAAVLSVGAVMIGIGVIIGVSLPGNLAAALIMILPGGVVIAVGLGEGKR